MLHLYKNGKCRSEVWPGAKLGLCRHFGLLPRSTNAMLSRLTCDWSSYLPVRLYEIAWKDACYRLMIAPGLERHAHLIHLWPRVAVQQIYMYVYICVRVSVPALLVSKPLVFSSFAQFGTYG